MARRGYKIDDLRRVSGAGEVVCLVRFEVSTVHSFSFEGSALGVMLGLFPNRSHSLSAA